MYDSFDILELAYIVRLRDWRGFELLSGGWPIGQFILKTQNLHLKPHQCVLKHDPSAAVGKQRANALSTRGGGDGLWPQGPTWGEVSEGA